MRKNGKFIRRKREEIGCSESRIWLLSANGKRARVLRTIERTANLLSERERR